MPPALTYVLLAGCAAVFFGVFFLDRPSVRTRHPRLSRFAFVIQGAALVAAYLVLRPGRGVDGRTAIETATAEGRPLLLDLYSNS